jgi:hypothetical protein
MSRIMRQLGLDYLTTRTLPVKGGREQAHETPPHFDEALLLYSRPLLDALAQAPGHRAPLLDLVRSTRIPIEDALKVLPELERRGLVVVEQRDLVGNHLLRLTDHGAQRLGS